MPNVISFPNLARSGLKVCLDSVDTLETAFKQIGRVIENCPDAPSKQLLIGQRQILQVALDHAKMLVAEIVEDLDERAKNYLPAIRPANCAH